MSQVRCAVVVPAAGRGRRMGGDTPKQFLPLDGEPVLRRTLRALAACPEVEEIVPVLPPDWLERGAALLGPPGGKVRRAVAGGATRQASVQAGLQALGPRPRVILVHDGVRPLVTPALVREAAALAARGLCAVVGLPLHDTVKRVDAGGTVLETPPREQLWTVQTPQAFPSDLLRRALERAAALGVTATDEAGLVERMGVPVRVVPGSPWNVKITSPEDLRLAEVILREGWHARGPGI